MIYDGIDYTLRRTVSPRHRSVLHCLVVYLLLSLLHYIIFV